MERVDFLVGPSNPNSTIIVERLMSQFPSVDFSLFHEQSDLPGGDALIALSFPKIVQVDFRAMYADSLVLHGSALPEGRGWSPGNWMLENLDTKFTMSLISMEEELDTGLILGQEVFEVPVWKTWPDYISLSVEAQIKLLADYLSGEIGPHTARFQEGSPTYFPKRAPKNSKIDPNATIAEQWGKFRAADPLRFPAYFNLHGRKFTITIQDSGATDDN